MIFKTGDRVTFSRRFNMTTLEYEPLNKTEGEITGGMIKDKYWGLPPMHDFIYLVREENKSWHWVNEADITKNY